MIESEVRYSKDYIEGFQDGLNGRKGCEPDSIETAERLIYTAYRDGYRDGLRHPDEAKWLEDGDPDVGVADAHAYILDPPWYIVQYMKDIQQRLDSE